MFAKKDSESLIKNNKQLEVEELYDLKDIEVLRC
jgi:hypothetical protein